MNLVQLIKEESGSDFSEIMLLRHSNDMLDQLARHDGSLEEYTFIQPINSRYDYWKRGRPQISTVVVIVRNEVSNVYRVLGIEQEGTTHSLASDAHRNFELSRQKGERPARRFKMVGIPSVSIGRPVIGWARRERIPVQRHGDAFFYQVEVDLAHTLPEAFKWEESFAKLVSVSERDTAENRRARLALSPRTPRRMYVTTAVFVRNPDVVAEVLARAAGKCELCEEVAPFKRRSNGSLYLEVHHKKMLADGGEDTVENAIAVCPNCIVRFITASSTTPTRRHLGALSPCRLVALSPCSVMHPDLASSARKGRRPEAIRGASTSI